MAVTEMDYLSGGGVDMSPLFGTDITYISTETVERPLCPVIGIKHVDVEKQYGTGGITIYGTDEIGTKTQIYSGIGTTNLDVSGYILLSAIRGSGNASDFSIKYID